MVDIDGRLEYSKIVSTRFSSTQPVRVYPVPARSVITVQFAAQFKQLEIVDISGKILLRKNISQQREEIDISTLAKGAYFIRLINGNTTISKQFVRD